MDEFYDAAESAEELLYNELAAFMKKSDIERALLETNKFFANLQWKSEREKARDKLIKTYKVTEFFKVNQDVGTLEGKGKEKYLECVKKLLNYAIVLLKQRNMRPGNWETIMVNNHVYEELISAFLENDGILEELGYRRLGACFNFKPKRKDAEQVRHVIQVATDLIILQGYVEVECGFKRADQEEIKLPERSSLVDLTKQDKIPDTCDVCDQPSVWRCKEKDAVDCRRKAWCDDCNQTWHVNNASRRGHGLIRIQRPRLGPASERKMIAGLKAQVKDAQPHRPPPIAAKPKSKAPAKTYQNLPAAAQPSPAAAPVFSRAGPTAASRPVPAPRRSVRNSSEEPIRSEVTSSSNHSTGGTQNLDSSMTSDLKAVSDLVDRQLASRDDNKIKECYKRLTERMKDIQQQVKRVSQLKKYQLSRELMGLKKITEKIELVYEEIIENERKLEATITRSTYEIANPPAEDEEYEQLIAEHHYASLKPDPQPEAGEYQDPLALSYLKPLREADRAGYTMDEMLLGLKIVPVAGLVNWLANSYVEMVKHLSEYAANTRNVPLLSDAELRRALLAHDLKNPEDVIELNCKRIIDDCIIHRQVLVNKYYNQFNDGTYQPGRITNPEIITREIIADLIVQCDADDEEIRRLLNDKVCEKITEHIWSPVDPDPDLLMSITENGPPVFRQIISILEDDTVDKNFKFMIAQAELGLSMAQTDQALHLRKKLTVERFYRFEFKDAITAVSSQIIGKDMKELHRKSKQYLSHKCQACLEKFPADFMANLCCHDATARDSAGECCKPCALECFTEAIQKDGIGSFVCPVRCGAPGDNADWFFNDLITVVFPNLGISEELFSKFQKKLTSHQMSQNPNFYWCQNPRPCSDEGFGFLYEGEGLRITCPQCNYSRCKNKDCVEGEWHKEHDNRDCQEFRTWMRENSEEYKENERKREEYMHRYGIECPRCLARFHLAKGGCMDCVCPECQFKFCSGCGNKIYKRGEGCPRNEELNCESKGLHSHHPRNCFYYLRDYDNDELKQLLQKNNAEFEQGKAPGGDSKCKLPEETDEGQPKECGLVEDENGLCLKHYKEYLAVMVNTEQIEVLDMLPTIKLILELKNNGFLVPEQPDGIPADEYRVTLTETIIRDIHYTDLSKYRNF